jgi:hypothetical protein
LQWEHDEDRLTSSYRKKAEQAEAREAMKQKRAEHKAVGGVGQQGGPASTVEY